MSIYIEHTDQHKGAHLTREGAQGNTSAVLSVAL